MTAPERDPVLEGAEAQQLLDSAIFRSVMAEYEKSLFERALEAPTRDDEARYRCLTAVTVLRKIRSALESKAFDATKSADEIANGGKSGWF